MKLIRWVIVLVLAGLGIWYMTSVPQEPASSKVMTDTIKEAMPSKAESTPSKGESMDKPSNDDKAMMDKPADRIQPTDKAMTTAGEAMLGGQYTSYASEKLALAKTGKAVLFFRASWCPSCKALDSDIRSNLSSIPKDLLILDVNYDTEKELKTKYGVIQQHTLVQVDADGKSLKVWAGSPKLQDLLLEVQ